jgi:hypothetical protein
VRPWSRSADFFPEFIVWTKKPAGTWFPLPCFFSKVLPSGLDGLWVQADGCCSKASWVSVEVTAVGGIDLTRGWQTFAHARGLRKRCTLHFTYDGLATLYVRVFGEDGMRAGCCPEDSSDDGKLGPDNARATSSSDESSSGWSVGAGVKREEGSD